MRTSQKSDGTIQSSERKVTIYLSKLPLSKLVNMRRLHEGMSAQECRSWGAASTAAANAILGYLDVALEPTASIEDGFKIVVTVNQDATRTKQDIIRLFAREAVILTDTTVPPFEPRRY